MERPQPSQPRPHRRGHGPTHAGIHFVEDQHRHMIFSAKTVFSASMIRESSPPDAMRLSGRSGSPMLLASKTRPGHDPLARIRARASSGVTTISKVVCSIRTAANSL